MAAAAIVNVASSLAHADLSDVIAGRPEAEALDALRIMCGALAGVRLRWAGLTASYSPPAARQGLVVALHACTQGDRTKRSVVHLPLHVHAHHKKSACPAARSAQPSCSTRMPCAAPWT